MAVTGDQIRQILELRTKEGYKNFTYDQVVSRIEQQDPSLGARISEGKQAGVTHEQFLNKMAYGHAGGISDDSSGGQSFLRNIGNSIQNVIQKRGEEFGEQLEETFEGREDESFLDRAISVPEVAINLTGNVIGTAFDFLGKGIKGAFDAVTTGEKRNEMKENIITMINEDPIAQAGLELLQEGAVEYGQWKAQNPRVANVLESSIEVGGIIPIGKAIGKPISAAIQKTKTFGREAFITTREAVEKLKPEFSDKAFIEIADEVTKEFATKTGKKSAKQIREAAEATASTVTFKERLAGVRPDIKKRIAGKRDQLQEFFDVAAARNLDDTLATPLEHAANKVGAARDELQTILNTTGSKIGRFRKKISTLQVSSDQMASIEKSFVDELTTLNLVIKNGKIARKTGKVAGKVSDGDIKALQGMFNDLRTVKAAPSSQNLIELRNAASQRINFGKQAREISNAVDPIARKFRGSIRDMNIEIIGKEQAGLLDEYSDLISILDELNTVVDSKSGAEFILKRVLSERGRIPREMLDRLKDATGVDLMDDAVMSQLATEIIGNSAQKGLLQQTIANAGVDLVDVATGYGPRAARGIFNLGGIAKDKLISPEKIFLEAAGAPLPK